MTQWHRLQWHSSYSYSFITFKLLYLILNKKWLEWRSLTVPLLPGPSSVIVSGRPESELVREYQLSSGPLATSLFSVWLQASPFSTALVFTRFVTFSQLSLDEVSPPPLNSLHKISAESIPTLKNRELIHFGLFVERFCWKRIDSWHMKRFYTMYITIHNVKRIVIHDSQYLRNDSALVLLWSFPSASDLKAELNWATRHEIHPSSSSASSSFGQNFPLLRPIYATIPLGKCNGAEWPQWEPQSPKSPDSRGVDDVCCVGTETYLCSEVQNCM